MRVKLLLALLGSAWVPLGCSGGDPASSVTPVRVPGGGVTGQTLEGVLHVHVVSAADDSPVADARVGIVGPSDLRLEGRTDAEGLLTFEDAALDEAVAVEVEADEHVPSFWFGVESANLTVPLSPRSTASATATVSGTVAGFEEVVLDDAADYLAAVVRASSPFDLDTVAGVGAPNLDDPLPEHVCIRQQGTASTCEWTLEARPGRQAHVATLLEGRDIHGTASRSDDVLEVVGFAVLRGVALEAGEVADETLRIEATAPAGLTVELPPTPQGQVGVVGVPGAGLGDEGVMIFPAPFTEDQPMTAVPVASALAGDTAMDIPYWVIAKADLGDRGMSVRIRRGIQETDAVVSLEPWLDPPAITGPSDAPALVASPGATVHLLRGRLADGRLALTGVVLGGDSDLGAVTTAGASSLEAVAVSAPSEGAGLRLGEVLANTTALASTGPDAALPSM